MADLDLARIKRNVSKMAAQNAPIEDIDGYIASEGTTIDAVRAFRAAPAISMPGDAPTAPSGAAMDITGQRYEGGVPVGGRPMVPRLVQPAVAVGEPQGSGVARNVTAGLNEVIYGTAGLPVDAMRGAVNLGVRGINAATGADLPQISETSFGGSRSIADMAGAINPALDPENTQAVTPEERVARGVGQGVAGTVLPAGLAAGALRSGVAAGRTVTPLMEALIGRSGASVGGAVGDAVAGGAAGAGAATAGEFASDEIKPLASLTGGIVGGGLGAVATGIPGLVREGGRIVGQAAEPFTAAGQQRRAATVIRDGASDPQAILDADSAGAQLVPGSMPTTGQLTGDMGALALERGSQTTFPAEFQQRRADQNAARRSALEGVQPTGAPEKVSQSIRSFLKTIDDEADAAVSAATETARTSAGRVGAGMRPDEAGASVRGALEAARAAAKERERALWSAVDPGGTLALSAGNVRRQAADIVKGLPASAKPPGGEEAAILDVLGRYGDVVPFSEMTALSSRLKSEMRAERMANGESPAYRRMSMLSGAIHQDLETAVAGKVRFEAREVAEGRMRVEDTLMTRAQQWSDEWYARKTEAGNVAANGSGPNAGGGSISVPGPRGAASEARGGSRNAPRDPGLSPNARGGAGEGFRPVSLTELKSLGADDPYFVKSSDGQTFVPRVLGNGGERTPDLGFAPDLESAGSELPIRIRRSDMVRHVGNEPHQNDARALGYADTWEMVQDLSANWTQMRRARYGRVQLVKPAHDGNGVAVVELAPSDDTTYWRVVSSHRNSDAQLGETILTRELPLDAPSGNSAPLFNDAPQGRRDPGSARDRIGPEYTADGAPPQDQAFDQAALDRLNAANGATRERAATFDNRTFAPIRARPATTSPYYMPASAVPARIFFAQPKSADAMGQFRQAVGDAQALATIEPYAIDQARRAALRDDGTFDPAKLDRWRRQHQDALRAFPDLDARLGDASRAAETMAEMAVTRREAKEAAQKGAVGKLVGIDSPDEMVRAVGSLFGRQDGGAQLANIKRAIGDDKDALEGLRKAVADHITGRLVGNTEVGTSSVTAIKSDQYQTFVRQNRPLLRVVFTDNEIRAMEAVAADLQRANRSIAAVRIPGQSNTAQDTLAARGADAPVTVLAKLLGTSAVAGGGVGAATGSLSGTLVGAGTLFAGALREAGLRRVDELVRDALLDPHKAKILLETVKPSERAKEMGLARRFRATALASAGMALQANDDRREKSSGPIPAPAARLLSSGNPLQDVLAGRSAGRPPMVSASPLTEAMAMRGAR